MLEFAPKSITNNQVDQGPEEEVDDDASIKLVAAEDLAKAPSYLRAQFDCDTLNGMLKGVNVLLAEVCAFNTTLLHFHEWKLIAKYISFCIVCLYPRLPHRRDRMYRT